MAPELSYEDLTPTAQTVVKRAYAQAAQRGAPQVEPVHILLGLLEVRNTLALDLLTKLQVYPQRLAETVSATLPPSQEAKPEPPVLGAAAQQVMRASFKEATHLADKQVDSLHLLAGLLYQPEGPAYVALSDAGVSLYELRQQALQMPRRFRTRQQDSLHKAVRPSPVFLGLVAIMAVSGYILWLGPNSNLVGPLTMIFVLSGWITSVCIHEFGHALTAYLGGDTSVRDSGYLTLNPLRYSHPLLSIVFPVIILLMGGFGLPGGAVYIRRGALRSQLWEFFVSAAGPLGTLLFALVITIPFYFDWSSWVTDRNFNFWPALAVLAFLQITAFLFNLLPIPPLDGFQMVAPYLPRAIRDVGYAMGGYGFFIIFLIFRSPNPLTTSFWQAAYHLAITLHIPLQLVAIGFSQFSWWRAL